ncbi:uncharacterized protein EHS24_008144 [Apiotrichum porosum]|uniref:Tubby C-terminal domain-containing protein n=1 Tax=Apiotrichum porosum TaxID=105984 RepID=A0A427XT03_9TREE|nr:uncharacterized protein EHS24_008144 [Apiotrichum porosum]RSH81947.1 hypothetical protein EHS24_008144 [Apiotrichum porosum]
MMGNDDFAVPDLPPLQPVSRAKGRLGLFADMVATQPTVLLLDFWMKWHKASGQVAAPFVISTMAGVPVLQCRGYRGEHWTKKRAIHDTKGNRLFRLSAKTTDGCRYTGRDGEDKELFRLYGNSTSALQVEFVDKFSLRPAILHIQGGHARKVVNITCDGQVVARTRRWDGHDKTYGRTTYRLEVAQGVDIALLAAIAICLDEQEKATRSSGSYDAASGGATSSGGGAFRDPVHVDPSGGVVTEGR